MLHTLYSIPDNTNASDADDGGGGSGSGVGDSYYDRIQPNLEAMPGSIQDRSCTSF